MLTTILVYDGEPPIRPKHFSGKDTETEFGNMLLGCIGCHSLAAYPLNASLFRGRRIVGRITYSSELLRKQDVQS